MKRHVCRILLAVLLCAIVNTTASAQDNGGSSGSPQPDDIGTPGLVSTADNLNLPLVPPPPNDNPPTPDTKAATVLPNTPIVVNPTVSFSDLSLGGTITQRLVGNLWRFRLVPFAHGDSLHTGKVARRGQQPSLVLKYTYEDTGNTLYVYSDGSFEMENKSGAIWLTGYFGYVGENTLVAIAKGKDGTRYAFHNGYYSAFTPHGDVVVGNAFTDYVYDFDEDGKLLSLTDSDGSDYKVQVADDGSTSIWGSDGDKVSADESGAFKLYDADGNLMVEGEMFDDAAVDQIAPPATAATPGDDGSGDGDGS